MKTYPCRKHGYGEKQKRFCGFIQDRRLRADRFIVRAQSTIRADMTPAAQAKNVVCPRFSCGRLPIATIARSARQPCFLHG